MRPYELRPNRLGQLVFGLDLKQAVSEEAKQHIIQDVRDHRLLIFKGQGVVSAVRQLEIGRWFGAIESTFYNHPKSPHRDVFRVSNDPAEGCTRVGRTGWHIDGSFQEAPFSHALYHIIHCPTEGTTNFAPLTELIGDLPEAKREFWDTLYMLSDRRDSKPRPLIYRHPETKMPVLCFHLGMTDAFQIGAHGRVTSEAETTQILQEIHHELVKDGGAIQYQHRWSPGDFLISDNLSVGHEASPETQKPVSEVGLRVMHRVTIAGRHPPTK